MQPSSRQITARVQTGPGVAVADEELEAVVADHGCEIVAHLLEVLESHGEDQRDPGPGLAHAPEQELQEGRVAQACQGQGVVEDLVAVDDDAVARVGHVVSFFRFQFQRLRAPASA